LKIGLQVISFDWPGSPENIGDKLGEIATTADETGFYSLWVMDHYFELGGVFGGAEAPMLEGYSAISYCAALTKRIKIGLLVTGNIYRHPGLLVKNVTTLDVLSGGRSYFGIGTGWYEQEARGLGVPFPPLKERFERLEETLQIAHQMWKGDRTPYDGKYYHLSEPINSPQPLSRPHPPILIGGSGEKITLRLVAKYADACNLYFGATPKEFNEWHHEIYRDKAKVLTGKLEVLKGHCEDVGRSYEDIEKTVLGTIRIAPGEMGSEDVVSLCRELNGLGFDHVIFNMPNVHEIEPIENIGDEVIPEVKDL